MKLEKLTFPIIIAAAIVGLWIALRPKGEQQTVSNQPSAQQSGVPGYVPQPQTYQVNPPQLLGPSQVQLLSDPWNANPGMPLPKNPPAYLTFNFGPGHDLTKVPLTNEQKMQLAGERATGKGCGCGGDFGDTLSGCGDPNSGTFPDGRGGLMAKSGPQLLDRLSRQDPGWINRAAYNLRGSDVPQNLPIFQRVVSEAPPEVSFAQQTPTQQTAAQAPSAPGTNFLKRPITEQVKQKARLEIVDASQAGGSVLGFGNQVPKLAGGIVNYLTGQPVFSI